MPTPTPTHDARDAPRRPAWVDPLTNKGTAYRHDERRRLGLEGLLPPAVESLDVQSARVLHNVRTLADPLERYRYLGAIQSENETLFYHTLADHLEELLPIVYTPTVGQACVEWSRIYERPRGLYVSAAHHRGRIAEVLRRWPRDRVGVIVVTDGGRILGLGDLGANGMGIPIGKLALYSACGGIPPDLCLPVTLDVGTDNQILRDDRFYLGDRVARLTGDAYDELLEEFVTAAQTVFPGAVLQFEDFQNAPAFRLLHRYRQRLCCFNDDIQGTGAMGLAGVYASARATRTPLVEQRLLFVGAGEACLGIGALVVAAMQREGMSESDAKRLCLFIDSKGVVVQSRDDLADHKRPFAQDRPAGTSLRETIEAFAPTALVGASGYGGLLTQPVLELMARLNDRPIIFALSNPTSKAECTAEEAYRWTSGRAIFASGSPFKAVTVGDRLIVPGQANNAFVFPGVGLGLLASGAAQATDEMFLAAARALAEQTRDEDLDGGAVFPPASRMRGVALAVGVAVATVAFEQGVATRTRPPDVMNAVFRAMYSPAYV